MKKSKLLITTLSLSGLLLVACGNDTNDDSTIDEENDPETEEVVDMDEDDEEMEDHGEMVHDESGDLPAGLTEANDPLYELGDEVKLLTDHMEGMNGAEAKIVGAYDTSAYEVSYDPTNGDPREENHKWVVHEEIKEAGSEPFELGDEVVLEAYHMEGMQGAEATIDALEDTTVYMVDYEPTTGGDTVRNHKWLTESELAPK